MIHAYDKAYLDKARVALGRMLDFAVYDLEYDISDFFDLFISSGVASRFEQGDFTLLAGMSGIEIAYTVLDQAGVSYDRIKPEYAMDRSEEFWTGWALAYYQWARAISFERIICYVPIREIMALYSPYHEMDIRQFVDKMDELYEAAKPETNLKLLRQNAGLSQVELAELSGIPVRTIQQYEQRQKNINMARSEYLVLLAQVLCCEVEDLLENSDSAFAKNRK